MNTEKKSWWAVAGYLFLASLAIIGIAAIVAAGMGWLKQEKAFLPEIALTILLIAGVGGLLIVLSCMVAVFAALNLSQRTHSLGLPEGSVRAVIALSLILIFSIQAVYLYGDLGQIETETSTGITQEQLNTIPKEQIVSIQAREVDDKTVFDVEQRVEKSEASVDFAKQILTTVSTLVVAVAGFYFGTRAVAAARGVEAPLLPVVRKIVPNHGEQGEELSVEIFGKNFQSPATVKLVQDLSEISGTDITWSTTKIKCKFKIPKDAATRKWDLIAMNEDGGEDRLAEAFEVKQTLPEEPENP
jgi:hypothetical protein